jgi:hypothetical protein
MAPLTESDVTVAEADRAFLLVCDGCFGCITISRQCSPFICNDGQSNLLGKGRDRTKVAS